MDGISLLGMVFYYGHNEMDVFGDLARSGFT